MMLAKVKVRVKMPVWCVGEGQGKIKFNIALTLAQTGFLAVALAEKEF